VGDWTGRDACALQSALRISTRSWPRAWEVARNKS
jgi:hypothetical protein